MSPQDRAARYGTDLLPMLQNGYGRPLGGQARSPGGTTEPMGQHTPARLAVALMVALAGCGGDSDVVAPSGTTVIHDPSAGPPGCSEWAAHPPTEEERQEGCIGDNGDLYLDAVAAVSPCESWTRRRVSQADVARGCRAAPVDLAVTADQKCVDGRTLFWNEAVWGYVGEPARAYPPDAEHAAPDAAREECSGG